MDTRHLIDDLVSITSRLVALMETEIERLRSHRPRDIESLQEEKASLARAYETLIGELRRHPEVIRGVAPALRDELAAKTVEFHRVLARNEAALRSAKEINARVLQAVADAVADQQKETGGYSRSGTLEDGRRGRAAKPAAVSVNETL